MAPIHEAAENFDIETLRRELTPRRTRAGSIYEPGVDPDVRDERIAGFTPYNRTALHWLTRYSSVGSPGGATREEEAQKDREAVPCIELLLEAGASVDLPDDWGSTALRLATTGDRVESASVLLAAGADVHLTDNMGDTALHNAALFGAHRCIELLLKHGASVRVRTNETDLINLDRKTPIDQAWWGISNGRTKQGAICLALLLKAGSDLPAERYNIRISSDPYLSRVRAAGGFPNYERAHLAALAETLSPKLAHLLPPELVRKVVEFYLHAGFYPFTPAKAPATATA